MSKRPTSTQKNSIGTQAGSALDAVVQPAQAVVDSVREVLSSAVSGVAGFMKNPGETASRQARAVTGTLVEVVRSTTQPPARRVPVSASVSASGKKAPSKRAAKSVAPKTRAVAVKVSTLVKNTARKAARKPTAKPVSVRRQH
jgi:hypothetical protein